MIKKIVKIRYVSAIKNPIIILCFLMALTSSVFIGYNKYLQKEAVDIYQIAIVDEDNSDLSDQLIKELSGFRQFNLISLMKNDAQKQVLLGKVDGAFIILDGFSSRIRKGEYVEVIELIQQDITSSANPISEVVSSIIMDIWLEEISHFDLNNFYNNFNGDKDLTIDEIILKVKEKYNKKDILEIIFVGEKLLVSRVDEKNHIEMFISVFALFTIMYIFLSSEWILFLKNSDLRDALASKNIKLATVSLASQFSIALVCLSVFIPALILFSILTKATAIETFICIFNFSLFTFSISFIGFITICFIKDLDKILVVSTLMILINVLLSSLIIPVPSTLSSSVITKILPGGYLYSEINSHIILLTFFYLLFAYFCSIIIDKVNFDY